MSPPPLNVDAADAPSWANGPGPRAVIWVRGCTRRCPGCVNSQLWDAEPRHLVDWREIAAWVDTWPELRGITLSGGEPFAQADPLACLARQVREHGGDVVAFSGYTYEELARGGMAGVSALLAETDLLVDGPYLADQPTELPLRGSANQRLHFLTGRIRPEEIEGLPRQEWIGGLAGLRSTGFSPSSRCFGESKRGDDDG